MNFIWSKLGWKGDTHACVHFEPWIVQDIPSFSSQSERAKIECRQPEVLLFCTELVQLTHLGNSFVSG